MILNRQNEDITDFVYEAAYEYGIPTYALLGLLIAESNLNRYAERWGLRTGEAKECLQVLGFL